MEKKSPLVEDYFEIKALYPDALLLFGIAESYQVFGKDALAASNALGTALISREGMLLTGFPAKDLGANVNRLTALGYNVAVCDQK